MRKRDMFFILSAFLLTLLFVSAPAMAQTAPLPGTQVQAAPAASDDFTAAMRLYRQRRYAQAIDGFQRITQGDPNNAAAWYFMGYAQYVSGNKSGALSSFSKAFTADPSFDPRPYFRRR